MASHGDLLSDLHRCAEVAHGDTGHARPPKVLRRQPEDVAAWGAFCQVPAPLPPVEHGFKNRAAHTAPHGAASPAAPVGSAHAAPASGASGRPGGPWPAGGGGWRSGG